MTTIGTKMIEDNRTAREIFADVMIDVTYEPVSPLLHIMNTTRYWVWCVYALLVATSWLGIVNPG